MKKKYLIEHDGIYGSITIEIDHGFIDKNGNNVNTIIKEMNDFWISKDKRLLENDGDTISTFLKQLCEKCMRILSADSLSVKGLINEFEDIEGWYSMNGDYGIKIIDCVEPDFTTQHLYTISEI